MSLIHRKYDMTGYLYHRNGSPIIERDYTSPGRYTMEHAEIRLRSDLSLKVGTVLNIHMGHGQYRRFECVAVDNSCALLQNCAH
jgi:hypothetical protein